MKIIYIRRKAFKFFKQSKTVFILHEWFNGFNEIKNQKKVNNIYDLKSKEQIKKDLRLIKNYWKCGTFHYWRYGLQYKNLSDKELLDYVPTYYHHLNLENKHKNIDTIKYGDKVIQANCFIKRDIPHANFIGIYKNGQYTDLLNNSLDFRTVINQKLKEKGNKFFFKPVNGNGGKGIFVLKRIENKFYINGVEFDLESLHSLLSINDSYIIEENIIQNAQMMSLNSSSVNTLRVVVQKENTKMSMKTCIIRMGRSGKEIDNSAQGGISVMVEVGNGKLAESATAEHGGGIISEHPDSNMKFKGIVLNNWNCVKREIEAIANKLIDFNDIALDIALTEKGPVLIEFNFRYGIEHQQCVLGGMRRVLKISN